MMEHGVRSTMLWTYCPSTETGKLFRVDGKEGKAKNGPFFPPPWTGSVSDTIHKDQWINAPK